MLWRYQLTNADSRYRWKLSMTAALPSRPPAPATRRTPAVHPEPKINVLKFFCDRPTHATANGAIVELADRHHLGRGTGEERLICDINFIAGDTFHDLQALILSDVQDAVAQDSFQTRGQLRRIQNAIPN